MTFIGGLLLLAIVYAAGENAGYSRGFWLGYSAGKGENDDRV